MTQEHIASTNHRPPREGDVDSPVFLLGAARSGTSLLYKALCLHPDAAWISNWVRRLPSFPQVAALNRVARALPARQREVWFGGATSNAYVYSSRRSLTERLFPMPVEGESVFTRCGIGEDPSGAGPDQERALARSLASVRRFDGGRRLICKRIANNRRVPLLARAFPAARFVEIVRDGRAVALSLSKVNWWEDSIVWWYGGTPRQWRDSGGHPLELCARNWVEELKEIEAGLQHVPADQVLRLTYEGFVSSPVETLEKVARFAGLPPDQAWSERLRQLRFPDRNEAWTRALATDDIARVEAVQRESLARHGYV